MSRSFTARPVVLERVFNGRVLAVRFGLVAVSVLVLAGCESTSQGPTPALQTASQFEKLDQTYFDASQAAVAKGHTIAPDAYQQAMNGLADANHVFAQGLQQIPFPDSAQADAKVLLTATVRVETDALLEAKTPGSTNLIADLDPRNAADKKLRGDLGLDPSEVP